MTPGELEDGYWRAYRRFYRARHLTYAGGWKKFEPLWHLLIRTGQVTRAPPLLESLPGSFGGRPSPPAAV